MKKEILIVLLLLLTLTLGAQESDTILRYDKPSKEVYRGDTIMSMEYLYRVMRPYPEAFKYIESSKESNIFANVFFTLGAIPLGFTLGYFLPTREFLWQPFVVGVGLIGIGIPLYVRSLKEKQRAVKSFNGRHDRTSTIRNNLDMSLCLSQNGIGFYFRF